MMTGLFRHTVSSLQRHFRHNTGENPILIRIETSAGHGAGKPTSLQIKEAADVLSFVLYNTKTTYKEIKGTQY